MLRNLFIRFILIIIATFLLIFIEYKFEVVDYLRFVNSAMTLEGRSIVYSSDGELMAIGKATDSKMSENKKSKKNLQIEIRKVSDHSLITAIDTSTTSNLTFNPDNSLIAAGNSLGKVYVWRIGDGELLFSFDHKINVNSLMMSFLSFTQGGQKIVTLISGVLSSSSNQVNVWDLANETNRTLAGEFISAALSPDGETLALGNRNNRTVDLYRLDDLTLIKQLDVSQIPITPKFSPDSKKIAFIGYSLKSLPGSISDRQIYLYNVEDGSLLNVFYYSTIFPKSKESLKNFAISPDGRYLAVSYSRSVTSDFFIGAPKWSDARYYGRIRVWRIEDGKQLQTFRGHKRRTSGLVFTPDSQLLTSTGADGKIRFWKMPPRNYSWFLMLGGLSLTALVYSRRSELISLLNR